MHLDECGLGTTPRGGKSGRESGGTSATYDDVVIRDDGDLAGVFGEPVSLQNSRGTEMHAFVCSKHLLTLASGDAAKRSRSIVRIDPFLRESGGSSCSKCSCSGGEPFREMAAIEGFVVHEFI